MFFNAMFKHVNSCIADCNDKRYNKKYSAVYDYVKVSKRSNDNATYHISDENVTCNDYIFTKEKQHSDKDYNNHYKHDKFATRNT